MDKLFKKISKNNFLKELSFRVAYLPLLRGVYRKIYQGRINKKVNNFKFCDLMVSIEPSNTCNALRNVSLQQNDKAKNRYANGTF